LDRFTLLAKINLALGAVGLLILGLATISCWPLLSTSGQQLLLAITLLQPTLHLVAALGCYARLNAARVACLLGGVLMLPLFPVGTIIGIVLIENSKRSHPTSEH